MGDLCLLKERLDRVTLPPPMPRVLSISCISPWFTLTPTLLGDTVVKPYIMGQDMRKGEKPQDMVDMMPSWVG